MAGAPAFTVTPRIGAGIPGTAETSLTVPVNYVAIFAAGATAGSKIEEIDIAAVTTSLAPTTVAGLVYLFLYDGTTNHLWDIVNIRASTTTPSASVAPYRSLPTDFLSGTNKPVNLYLPVGWTLRASQSIAGNASILKVTAFGGDY